MSPAARKGLLEAEEAYLAALGALAAWRATASQRTAPTDPKRDALRAALLDRWADLEAARVLAGLDPLTGERMNASPR